jgi:hypothetical protein
VFGVTSGKFHAFCMKMTLKGGIRIFEGVRVNGWNRGDGHVDGQECDGVGWFGSEIRWIELETNICRARERVGRR